MRNIFGAAALVAAIAAVGFANPADAKPKHHHGHHHHAYAGHSHGYYGPRHAYRHDRWPGYRYSGSSMAPGWQGWYGGDWPPGWGHGVKRGWHGHGVPPGHWHREYR